MREKRPDQMEFPKWPTKPVDEIVGSAVLAAFHGISAGDGCIVERGSIGLHGPLGTAIMLTAPRELTENQIERMRNALTTPESYWIGHPIYRRFPPKPGFLLRLQSSREHVDVAVDLQNPGWRIDCAGRSYWGFTFAGAILRGIAKDMFPEYASSSKSAVWKKGSLPNKTVNPSGRSGRS